MARVSSGNALRSVSDEHEDHVALRTPRAQAQEGVDHDIPPLLDREASDADEDHGIVAPRVVRGEGEQLAATLVAARVRAEDLPRSSTPPSC